MVARLDLGCVDDGVQLAHLGLRSRGQHSIWSQFPCIMGSCETNQLHSTLTPHKNRQPPTHAPQVPPTCCRLESPGSWMAEEYIMEGSRNSLYMALPAS